jgi:uncharacterized membrane protein
MTHIFFGRSRQLPNAIATVVLAFFILSSSSQAEEVLFQVVRVEPNDVLNVRAEPRSTANKVGTLPFDGRDIQWTGATHMVGLAQWKEIRIGQTTGWVNAQYLTIQETINYSATTLFREPLSCIGTEPFWGLQLQDSIGEVDTLEGDIIAINFHSAARAGGGAPIWSLRGETKVTQSSAIAILERTNSCSDGMSDLLYKYSIRLDVAEGPFFAGCCNRLPGQSDP